MKKTEKDVVRRIDLTEDISQIRRVLTRMLDGATTSEDDELKRHLMLSIDELDLLEQDLKHKAVGRKYPLLDPHKSATRSMRKDMRKFDEELKARLRVVHDATKKISTSYLEGALEEPAKELSALHHHIVEARNYYEERDMTLKGVDVDV